MLRFATLPACSLSHPTVNCSSLLDDARRAGSLRMLLLGVELAHSLNLCEVPSELLDAARRDSHVASLGRRVARGIFNLQRSVELDEWLIGLATIEAFRDRISYLIERVAAPKLSDRVLMPLPQALYPLYYVARPMLLATKHRPRLFRKRSHIGASQS